MAHSLLFTTVDSKGAWKAQTLISWLVLKPADLDLHCFLERIYPGLERSDRNISKVSSMIMCFQKIFFKVFSIYGHCCHIDESFPSFLHVVILVP